jgi:hypothetical protein
LDCCAHTAKLRARAAVNQMLEMEARFADYTDGLLPPR